jgi:hypothetical protein
MNGNKYFPNVINNYIITNLICIYDVLLSHGAPLYKRANVKLGLAE